MKRVVFDYLTLAKAEEMTNEIEILESENGYYKVLDLFDGESFWLKGIDIEAKNSGNYKHGLDIMVKVSFKDKRTYIDGELVDEVRNRFEEMGKDKSKMERLTWTKYLCLMMFNLKLAEDKEIIISEKDIKISAKPSSYKYNANKPTIITNVTYKKKEFQGREYIRQAENWQVRTHYRTVKGKKYLVKGYNKKFKGE